MFPFCAPREYLLRGGSIFDVFAELITSISQLSEHIVAVLISHHVVQFGFLRWRQLVFRTEALQKIPLPSLQVYTQVYLGIQQVQRVQQAVLLMQIIL